MLRALGGQIDMDAAIDEEIGDPVDAVAAVDQIAPGSAANDIVAGAPISKLANAGIDVVGPLQIENVVAAPAIKRVDAVAAV